MANEAEKELTAPGKSMTGVPESDLVRDLRDQLAQAHAAVDAANQAKDDFLATMSHEIRTPMNGILGMTEMLQRTNLSTQQREFAEAVRQSADALLHVINNTLDFATIKAGAVKLAEEVFEIRTVVDSVIGLLQHKKPPGEVRLAAVVHRDAPRAIRGDPDRLRQILLNLVGNGIKFTYRGSVVLRVRRLPNDLLRCEVADTGVGLTAADAARLFQPFVQVDASPSRQHAGAGLGLAICRRLAESMGGRIGVESRLGQGSLFWFEVPLQPDAVSAPWPHADLAPAHLLLATRDRLLDETITEALAARSIDCDTVAEWPEAAARIAPPAGAKNDFRLLLLDEALLPAASPALATAPGGSPLAQAQVILLIDPDRSALRLPPGIHTILPKTAGHAALLECIVRAIASSHSEPARSGTIRGGTHPQLGQLRILLAEDNSINRRLCTLQLERLGCPCDSVANGMEVIAAISRQSYDVILMDCQMPEMDGYQATQTIRELEALQPAGQSHRTQIIALTGDAIFSGRKRGLAAGMDEYLTKPFSSEQLEAALSEASRRLGAAPGPSVSRGAPSFGQELSKLCEELGEAPVCEILSDLAKDIPRRLASLRESARRGENKRLEIEAHALKGICANMGLSRLASALQDLEANSATGAPSETEASLVELEEAAAEILPAIEAWIASRTRGG